MGGILTLQENVIKRPNNVNLKDYNKTQKPEDQAGSSSKRLKTESERNSEKKDVEKESHKEDDKSLTERPNNVNLKDYNKTQKPEDQAGSSSKRLKTESERNSEKKDVEKETHKEDDKSLTEKSSTIEKLLNYFSVPETGTPSEYEKQYDSSKPGPSNQEDTEDDPGPVTC